MASEPDWSFSPRKPFIGEIVHFQRVLDEPPLAAIITALHSNQMVELTVFPPRGVPGYAAHSWTNQESGHKEEDFRFMRASVPTPGMWNWIS